MSEGVREGGKERERGVRFLPLLVVLVWEAQGQSVQGG